MKFFLTLLLFSSSAFALNCPFVEQNTEYTKTVAVCEDSSTGAVACLAEYVNSGNYKVQVEDLNIVGQYNVSFSGKQVRASDSKEIVLKDKTFGLGIIGYKNIQFELNKKKQTARFKFKTIGCGFSIMNDSPDPHCQPNRSFKFDRCSI
ncbi:MAG: hypothetical protein CME71_03020 [Halobacteriovorax sp.]|nr:hypothetical protein [Halobacteriovorax sp.]|tara:strand:+ start:44 stop:490 length:447 start_codon:yes stop_codon:yes gene_type:complete